MAAVLHVEDLEFRYRPAAPLVLQIKELRLEAGEKVFIHGPSGCGKTTLLGLLAGILAPTSGRLRILEQDLASLSSHERDAFRADQVGYIFQLFNLIPYLTVGENIELSCRVSKKRRERLSGKELHAEAQRLATGLGLAAKLSARATELSVGQQQRVAVARALLGQPPLIIADEPTSALDQDAREAFIKLLFHMAKESAATVVFVSHDQTLRHLFDRVIALPEINTARRS